GTAHCCRPARRNPARMAPPRAVLRQRGWISRRPHHRHPRRPVYLSAATILSRPGKLTQPREAWEKVWPPQGSWPARPAPRAGAVAGTASEGPASIAGGGAAIGMAIGTAALAAGASAG